MTRRRQMPITDLRLSTHALRVLQIMAQTGAHIHYDADTCVLMLPDKQRKISHRCLKSLRSIRVIRPRDTDPALYVLTRRAHELLAKDSRTRPRVTRDQTVEDQSGVYCSSCYASLHRPHFEGCSFLG